MKDRGIVRLFIVVIGFVAIWGILYPNLSILLASLQNRGMWTLNNYYQTLTSPIILKATWNSLWISLATVLGSALVGGGLALLFQFLEFPGRRIFAALAPLPLLMPPLIGVLAFIFLYGESGILSRAVARLLGLEHAPWRLNGPEAIIAVHVYSMYAYFYMFVSAGLQRIDYSLLAAARSLGASPSRAFVKVLLPLLRPAIISACLLTFMNSMASFSAPYLFGGGTPMLTLQIFNAKASNQWEIAMAESVILALISLSGLIWLRQYQQQEAAGGSKGSAMPRRALKSSLARTLALVVSSIALLFILLPPLTLVLMSFVKDGSWTLEILPPVYTLENYRLVFNSSRFLEPIQNSLLMSGLSALANLLFALPAAYIFARQRFLGKKFLTIVLMIPWALPGTVLGLSFAASYARATTFNAGVILIGTFWILPIIYFLRNLPLVVRSVETNLAQIDLSLEEASRSLGGNFLYTLRKVLLPLVMPGAISGTVLAFATAMGEFVASVIVYVPTSRPISIEIAVQLRDFRVGSASVYGVLLIIIIALSLILSWRIAGLDNKSLPNN